MSCMHGANVLLLLSQSIFLLDLIYKIFYANKIYLSDAIAHIIEVLSKCVQLKRLNLLVFETILTKLYAYYVIYGIDNGIPHHLKGAHAPGIANWIVVLFSNQQIFEFFTQTVESKNFGPFDKFNPLINLWVFLNDWVLSWGWNNLRILYAMCVSANQMQILKSANRTNE